MTLKYHECFSLISYDNSNDCVNNADMIKLRKNWIKITICIASGISYGSNNNYRNDMIPENWITIHCSISNVGIQKQQVLMI